MTKIIVPAVNEYPFEKGHEWAKRSYASSLSQVNKRKIQFLERDFQIRTADYVEKMTFGLWRLIGPPSGHSTKEAPLDIVLETLKPHIIKGKWGQFRREFIRHFKPSFIGIHNSNYLSDMVKDRNDHMNELVNRFTREDVVQFSPDGASHMDFVLHPETVESYNSPRCLEIRSRIWDHFAGKPLDMNDHSQVTTPIPGRPCQMEMHLDIQVSGQCESKK
jgi:primosomal replication protein N